MGFSEVVLLFTIFIGFLLYRLLFRENIDWRKLFNKAPPDPKSLDRQSFSKKFRSTSLYKAALKVLNLEEAEALHCENIGDNFKYYCDLSDAIKAAGLESSNIIIGVDFTASNEWQGRNSFDHKSLHTIFKNKRQNNPYQQVITTLSTVLEPFDGDNLIPAYGFGDVTTKDKSVFPFNRDESPCKGFINVLRGYEEVLKNIELSGPTSFVPIINKAIAITKELGLYHILVIIADGQVEDEQDEATRKAIVEASYYPLSIIVVGIGDGPWENMHAYDERLPARTFDNFQFVNYNECILKSTKSPELSFALQALMEIPDQYKAIKRLGLLKEKQKSTQS